MRSSIKKYREFIFENSNSLTEEQISFLDEHIEERGGWEYNDKTGKVDLFSSFRVLGEKIPELPVEFGICYGDFEIIDCGLKSIKGLPTKADVVKLLSNDIKDLSGLNIKTSSAFNISKNPITSFFGTIKFEPYTLVAYECNLITIENVNFRSFNFEENPIPYSFLQTIDYKGDKVYYRDLMDRYEDKVLPLWDTLHPDLQRKIANANDTSIDDISRLSRSSQRII